MFYAIILKNWFARNGDSGVEYMVQCAQQVFAEMASGQSTALS